MPLTVSAVVLEVIGSILIVAGGFGADRLTRIGALLFVPVMLGAILLFHIKHGWQKMELEFCLLMVSLYVALRGNDRPAADSTRSRSDTADAVI